METNTDKEMPFNFLMSSRWDYGGSGCRPGLLQLAKDIAIKNNAEFHVVAGGVVNRHALKLTSQQKMSDVKAELSRLRAEISDLKENIKVWKHRLEEHRNRNKTLRKSQRDNLANKIADAAALQFKKEGELEDAKKWKSVGSIENEMIEKLARQINDVLPVFYRKNGEVMKHYIVTSHAYDGPIGVSIVKRLVELRRETKKVNDVVYVNAGDPTGTTHRIKLKNTTKTFAVVVPNKVVWRSRYYSTAPDRYIEDEVKRSTQPHCDYYAFGCGSSSLNRREGEISFQRWTIPSLCKLENAQTSENMIGVRIVKIVPGQKNATLRTISFKDFVSNERQLIKAPKGASVIQKAIIEELKQRANLSPGVLEDLLRDLKVTRKALIKEIQHPRMKKAGLEFDALSGSWDFNKDVFLSQLYSWPEENFKKEVLAVIACTHFGSIHTYYRFITVELPALMAKHRVKHLLMVGDVIEGIKHNLIETGEVALGIDVTTQEEVAAYVTAHCMLKTLDLVLQDVISVEKINVKTVDSKETAALVEEHLLDCLYWVGNHDDWTLPNGVWSLMMFDSKLKEHLFKSLEKVLIKNGLPRLTLDDYDKIVKKRVIRMQKNNPRKLSSGVQVDGAHYYARRSMTSSSWPQMMLSDLKNGHVVVCANFHVAEALEEASTSLGLRSSIMIPTSKVKTRFESNMGKRTDFGGVIQSYYTHNGRGMINEVSYIGENPHTSFDNNKGLKLILEHAGVGEYSDIDEYLENRLPKG